RGQRSGVRRATAADGRGEPDRVARRGLLKPDAPGALVASNARWSPPPPTASPSLDPYGAAMEIEIGRGKKARRAYGFDDVAIVPSRRTRDPDDVDISWTLGPYRFELPLLASAMDGVVSPETAGILGRLGGLAVLNLEGIWTRYEDADSELRRIASFPKETATRQMQEVYKEPIKPELVAQ